MKFWRSFSCRCPKKDAAATIKTTSKHLLTWVPKRWLCELPTNTHTGGLFLGFVGWTRTSIPSINWRPRKHDAFKCPCASVKQYWYTCTYTRSGESGSREFDLSLLQHNNLTPKVQQLCTTCTIIHNADTLSTDKLINKIKVRKHHPKQGHPSRGPMNDANKTDGHQTREGQMQGSKYGIEVNQNKVHLGPGGGQQNTGRHQTVNRLKYASAMVPVKILVLRLLCVLCTLSFGLHVVGFRPVV